MVLSTTPRPNQALQNVGPVRVNDFCILYKKSVLIIIYLIYFYHKICSSEQRTCSDLKGVFSGHKIMGEMVAIICVNITSVSFFHYFAPNFGGKHSGLIFGTQLSHPKITILNPCHINNYTVEFLESVLVVFSRCGSCVPKMWQLCSKDVNVVF